MGWAGEVLNFERSKGLAGAVAVYTTSGDFCRLFKEDMRGLYALSLLLTADSELAQRCFVAGLDDCIKGNPVFKGWADAWSRRAIIMNAIRTVFSPDGASLQNFTQPTDSDWSFIADSPLAKVTRLDSLERFAFVMSFLEEYSDHECAVLLNRSRSEVVAARTRALQHLGDAGSFVEILKTRKISHAAPAADL